jgi:type IV secretory pathway VirB9-like protein
MKLLLTLLAALFPTLALAQANVRTIEVVKDQIITVNTKLGIATLIQLPDRPSSIVIGDQSSFKVEYLDKAVTVKPLIPGARTNLYLYTDLTRFNVELIPVRGGVSPDYVVYLKNASKKLQDAASVTWRIFRKQTRAKALTLEIKRIGSSKEGSILIDFRVRSQKPKSLTPEALWVIEGGTVRPIQQLYLADTRLSPVSPIDGQLNLRRADFNGNTNLKLEVRSDETLSLTIPKAALWN